MDRELLQEHIQKNDKTVTQLATEIGITREALHKKLKPLDAGGTEFKASEIQKIVKSLKLSMRDVQRIFFNH